MQQSTMSNKICLPVHSGNFSCDKIVHLSVHMSPIHTYIHTYITLFNFGFKRIFRIFLLADVKCHYYELGVQGIYTILILDIHVMITIINNCQNRVSADQCHMTVS